jgi:transglutaminase-like putative cysteine protease
MTLTSVPPARPTPPAQPRPAPQTVPARASAPVSVDPKAPPTYLIPTLIGALAVLAASSSIPPMISGDDWLWPTVEVVLVIWLVGVGARLARIPAALAVVLQFAAASVALTALFTVGGIGGVLPNGAALSEAGDLLTGAWEQIRTNVSPAPSSTELAFLITVSVGATALIVDILIAVCRAPALVALPLLCVYSVPASIDLQLLPWEAFAAPAMLYALLLTADGLTGRRLGTGAGTARVASGVVLGCLATVIALLAANALTAVGTEGRLPRTASGPSSTVGLSPFAALKGNLTRTDPIDLFRVTGLDQPQYLRTVGLQKWTAGTGWSIDELSDGRLPTVPPAADAPQITVTSLNYRDEFLPIYDGTSSVAGAGPGWFYDAALASVHRPDPVVPEPYRVAVVFRQHTAEQLRKDTVTPGGALTDTGSLPEEVVQTARDVTANATTAFDKAEALRNYFTDPANGFTYSLTVAEGDSGDALVDFLRNKQGYCAQYASAMAIMLRALDIPARAAVGFTQGTRDSDGSYLIRSNDAHAWVEVNFDNAGWVKFDPTPLGGGQGGQQGFTDAAQTTTSTSAAPSSGASQTSVRDEETRGAGAAAQLPDEQQTSAASGTSQQPAVPTTVWYLLGALLILIAAGAGPTVVRGRRRRNRLAIADAGGPDAATAAWREIEDLAVDHGIVLNPSESARSAANRLSKVTHLSEKGRQELRAVVTRAEQGWYGTAPGLPNAGSAGGTGAAGSPAASGRTATLEAPVADRPAVGLGAAPRTLARELAHATPLSPLDRLIPRSVRPTWWRD